MLLPADELSKEKIPRRNETLHQMGVTFFEVSDCEVFMKRNGPIGIF